MTKAAKYYDNDDAFDERGILKDGKTARISKMMRDAAMSKPRSRDSDTGFGSNGPRGQQPGDTCDINGVEGRLVTRNGKLVCVPLRSQDAASRFSSSEEEMASIRQQLNRPVITDGTTNPLGLNKPGYRFVEGSDRRQTLDEMSRYETGLVNSFKLRTADDRLCPECGGNGRDESGAVCEECNGSGVVSSDDDNTEDRSSSAPKNFGSSSHSSGDSRATQDRHRQTMDRLYRERDEELSQAWKQR